MSSSRDVESFLFRGLSLNRTAEELTEKEEVLEQESRKERRLLGQMVPLEQFSLEVRIQARRMAPVYELLFAFENAVRELVESRLKETLGVDNWWTEGVRDDIRMAAEKREREEKLLRWHGPRGDSKLNYVDFVQLADIILNQWDDFEDLVGNREFIRNRFEELNLSRRVLAHTGVLSQQDVTRMVMYLQDWIAQVG